MRKWLLIIFAGIASPAFAQQQAPETQALGQKLMSEIGAGIQCSAALITAQAEIKRLTDKYEPKPPEPKKR